MCIRDSLREVAISSLKAGITRCKNEKIPIRRAKIADLETKINVLEKRLREIQTRIQEIETFGIYREQKKRARKDILKRFKKSYLRKWRLPKEICRNVRTHLCRKLDS